MTDFIELTLTQAQAEILAPIVATEPPRRPVLFLSSAAPDWDREKGDVVWRWQVVRLDWRRAAKVLKIIEGR
jgi:hypothetical protein